MRTKEHFISICGEKIKCPNEMKTQEYQAIFNNTIKNLLTSQKITPEMIEETKYSNQEENKISTAPKR